MRNLPLVPHLVASVALAAWVATAAHATESKTGSEPAAADSSLSARTLGRLLITDATRVGGKRLVAVGEHGHVIYSDDEGKHWLRGTGTRRVMMTSVRFADAEHGWAVGHDGVILATTDGGTSWSEQRFMPDEEKPLLAIWCKDANEAIAIGAYGLFVETHDGGKTWNERSIIEADTHLNAITAFGEGKLAIAGEAGAILISNDAGKTWTPSVSPYQGSYFGLLRMPDSALLAFGLRGKVFRSEDAGITWAPIDSGGPVSLLGGGVTDDGLVVLVGPAGAVRVSRDAGHSFTVQPAGLPTAFSAALPLDAGHALIFGEAGMTALELAAAKPAGAQP